MIHKMTSCLVWLNKYTKLDSKNGGRLLVIKGLVHCQHVHSAGDNTLHCDLITREPSQSTMKGYN